MAESAESAESGIPIMCALSPNDLIDRLAELEELFARGLTGVERKQGLLRMTFDVAAAPEAEVRELFGREQRCCAFLRFGFVRAGGGLAVEVTAPPAAAATLDDLRKLAEQAQRAQPAERNAP